MMALTISQPYASFITDGHKWIENRTWATRHRGELAIHAGKGTQYLSRKELEEYPNGCVIAVCQLVACVTLAEIKSKANSRDACELIPGTRCSWTTAAEHFHAEGPWCWILQAVREIGPVHAAGRQMLWRWDPAYKGSTQKRRTQ